MNLALEKNLSHIKRCSKKMSNDNLILFIVLAKPLKYSYRTSLKLFRIKIQSVNVKADSNDSQYWKCSI